MKLIDRFRLEGRYLVRAVTGRSRGDSGARPWQEVAASMRRSLTRWAATLCCLGLSFEAVVGAPIWFDQLPKEVTSSLLWVGDHESGDLSDWLRPKGQFPGSGIFNTGGQEVIARATDEFAHTGTWSAQATITNAYRAQNGARAVRLMAWTDRPWDHGGKYLPNEAYFSTWMMIPHAYQPKKEPPWDPGDGGWWNVFQFKTLDSNGTSQPVWTLNVASADDEMYFYLFSHVNKPSSYQQDKPRTIAPGQWIHVEAYLQSATQGKGRITVFQDGVTILDAEDVTTSLGGMDGTDTHPIWGIGNYTDHITGDPKGSGRATVYFDDAAISTAPLHPYAAPSLRLDCNRDGAVDGSDVGCACGPASRMEMFDGLSWIVGDLDGDGEVQLADFLKLAANFGQAVDSYTDGDLDCNGHVSFADFLILSSNFGNSARDLTRSVPEPIFPAAVSGGLLVLSLSRRRNRTTLRW